MLKHFLRGVFVCSWQQKLTFVFSLAISLGKQAKALDDVLSNEDKLELALLTGEQTSTIEAQAIRHLQERPRSAFAHYLLAEFYIHRFLLDEETISYLIKVKDLSEQAIELEPKSQFGYLAKAHVLMLTGQMSQAKATLEYFKEQNYEFDFRIEFSLLKMSHLETKAAIKRFQELAKKSVMATNLVLPHLIFLATKLNPYEAKDLLQDLSEKYPANLQVQRSFVKALCQIEAFNEALARLAFLQKSNLYDTELAIYHAFLLGEKSKNYERSASELKGILAKTTLSTALKVAALSYLGVLAVKQNQMSIALDRFSQALLVTNPSVEQLGFIMAHLIKAKKYEALVKLIDRLVNEASAQAPLLALQGEVFSFHLNKKKEALSAFQKAILLDPENSEYLNSLGILHFELGELKEALRFFEEALVIDDKNFAAHYNKACVLSTLGNPQGASWHLKEAFRINPTLDHLDNDLARTMLIHLPYRKMPK